jgi:hypothetical protein
LFRNPEEGQGCRDDDDDDDDDDSKMTQGEGKCSSALLDLCARWS